jgi:hypothetical protein
LFLQFTGLMAVGSAVNRPSLRCPCDSGADKDQETVLLTEADASATLGSLVKEHEALTGQPGVRTFLKCGRFLIETK